MRPMNFLFLVLAIISCNSNPQGRKKAHEKQYKTKSEEVFTSKSYFITVTELSGRLKEISGIVKDGNRLWAISDDPKEDIYRLDSSGKVVQQLKLRNITLHDVEDVTVDGNYLYIADIGDNNGSRGERQIIKIEKKSIGSGTKTDVAGETISFVFPGWRKAKSKKDNNYDCEAILCYKDSLYIFTKRRSDEQTELFSLPKIPGRCVAQTVASFNSDGLITGAALNYQANEVALIGYHSGHQKPFIWLLRNFKNNNFFSGQQQRFNLTNSNKDWQTEGVTYKDDMTLYFTCEESKDEPATLYSVAKQLIAEAK